ncbi:MAG: trk system potassium uptake protein TrkH [Verrucomicrobiales bacterium]|jgi:trk system potassium uptake protein TrkH
MNYLLIARNVGYLLILLAVSMGVCLGLGYVLPAGLGHSSEKALNGWEISMGITLVVAVALLLVGRKAKSSVILRRDAVGIVGIGWLVSSAFAALPYMLCEPGLGVTAAYFESVSGLTTTGASVFENLVALPQTILLWRSLTQWIGGLGILAMFVLVLSGLGASGRNLFQGESSAQLREFAGAPIRETARSLWILYIVLTIVCGLGLKLFGMTWFQAVNHALTTTSTGGFGTEGDSLNGFGAPVRLWVLFFMFACGVSFPLYLILLHKGRDWRTLKSHDESRSFVIILVVVSICLISSRAVTDNFESGFWEGALETVFNVVSVATTTGFVIGDYDSWPAVTKGFILFLMIVGGCAGSTAGGLKVSRLLLWFRMVRIEIRRAFRPNETVSLRLNGRPVPEGTRGQLFVIITAAVAAICVSSVILVALEPEMSVDGCVSAVITCVSNVGPAFNEFGPTHNFAKLSAPGMVLLSLLMILGRLEYVALLALFSRTLWKRF